MTSATSPYLPRLGMLGIACLHLANTATGAKVTRGPLSADAALASAIVKPLILARINE